ncbi:MAG: linear amide C-N hydrolase, partial [Butyricicoccus sp.]|nr:linear amide C-N hydrolase [Butyricicoccus sp.]
MCTALIFSGSRPFFGRNLDLEYSYEETVTITPRNFPLHFRRTKPLLHHYALLGIAYVQENYPLYYDAANEKGLAIAGLRFPASTVYQEPRSDRISIAPFELIPWLLGQCANVGEAQALLQEAVLARIDFRADLPCTPLHWLIADQTRSIVVESTADGLQLYDNPVGILTNEPPFPQQLHASEELTCASANDYSSRARFQKLSRIMRAAKPEPIDAVRFLHLLRAVSVPCRGLAAENPEMITRYSSCCDLSQGIYYYTTYENSTIHAVDLRHALRGEQLAHVVE